MLTRLYRYLPASLREKIYTLFLGKTLAVIRNPKLTWQGILLKYRFKRYLFYFRNKNGIEVGGPSAIFSKKEALPIYALGKIVDGCNYSSVTVWEGTIKDEVYRYGDSCLGKQYIGEATEVASLVKPRVYDFVISSNCLEHVANPIKALKSWIDVLKPGGVVLLLVPYKKNNFDHRRPDTLFEHLIRDYEEGVTEADITHRDEIMALHDLARDSGAGDFALFRERCEKNVENRCFHHHIFHPDCLVDLFGYLDLTILFLYTTEADHIILGQKK